MEGGRPKKLRMCPKCVTGERCEDHRVELRCYHCGVLLKDACLPTCPKEKSRRWTDVADRLKSHGLMEFVSDVVRSVPATMYEVCGGGLSRSAVKGRHRAWQALVDQKKLKEADVAAIWEVDTETVQRAIE